MKQHAFDLMAVCMKCGCTKEQAFAALDEPCSERIASDAEGEEDHA